MWAPGKFQSGGWCRPLNCAQLGKVEGEPMATRRAGASTERHWISGSDQNYEGSDVTLQKQVSVQHRREDFVETVICRGT